MDQNEISQIRACVNDLDEDSPFRPRDLVRFEGTEAVVVGIIYCPGLQARQYAVARSMQCIAIAHESDLKLIEQC